MGLLPVIEGIRVVKLKVAVLFPHNLMGKGLKITGFGKTVIVKSTIEKHWVMESNNLQYKVVRPLTNGSGIF
jgi:hypothetical protein